MTNKKRKISMNSSQNIDDSNQGEIEEIEMIQSVQNIDLEKQKKEDELKKLHESITSYM